LILFKTIAQQGSLSMAQSIGSITQARRFNFEQLELQVSMVEILLDVAERRGAGGASALKRARDAYEVLARDFLSALTPQEEEEVAERVQSIQTRLSAPQSFDAEEGETDLPLPSQTTYDELRSRAE
jgi:hypothetical protein